MRCLQRCCSRTITASSLRYSDSRRYPTVGKRGSALAKAHLCHGDRLCSKTAGDRLCSQTAVWTCLCRKEIGSLQGRSFHTSEAAPNKISSARSLHQESFDKRPIDGAMSICIKSKAVRTALHKALLQILSKTLTETQPYLDKHVYFTSALCD